MKYTIEGTVLEVGEAKTYGQTFTKREVVIKSGTEEYPKGIPFEFTKDGISKLDGINVGDVVRIGFFVEGSREWNGRYFPSLHGFEIVVVATSVAKTNTEAAKPVRGCTQATAIEEWTKKHGEDIPGFAAFCKQLKPGKPSKTYTISDWADVVNAIQAADAQAAQEAANDGATDPDDLPF